jgi:hypothetical protein
MKGLAPPYSPDLNYFFWAYTMMQVRRRKPGTIDKLKETVEDVRRTIPEEMVQEAVANIRKRCQACEAASCGYFKAFLKQFQKQFFKGFCMLTFNFFYVL